MMGHEKAVKLSRAGAYKFTLGHDLCQPPACLEAETLSSGMQHTRSAALSAEIMHVSCVAKFLPAFILARTAKKTPRCPKQTRTSAH